MKISEMNQALRELQPHERLLVLREFFGGYCLFCGDIEQIGFKCLCPDQEDDDD